MRLPLNDFIQKIRKVGNCKWILPQSFDPEKDAPHSAISIMKEEIPKPLNLSGIVSRFRYAKLPISQNGTLAVDLRKDVKEITSALVACFRWYVAEEKKMELPIV